MNMSDNNLRWELEALKSEYNQHWEHFRHAIDKSYQAFNIHLVIVALLFSAISLAYETNSGSLAIPLFIVIGLVAFVSAEGTISTLVVQRSSYVLYRKVIDVLRERISNKVGGLLQPEVEFFHDLKIFKPGTAWFNRVNFVILTSSSLTVVCTYLTISSLALEIPELSIDSFTILLVSFAIFILTAQKLYYSVINRSNDRARSLFCKMQRYENPPSESREIKALMRYGRYLLASAILTTFVLLGFIGFEFASLVSIRIELIIIPSAISVILLLVSIRLWFMTRCEVTC